MRYIGGKHTQFASEIIMLSPEFLRNSWEFLTESRFLHTITPGHM